MPQVARRFTIFTLTMLVFALVFSDLVRRSADEIRVGSNTGCSYSGRGICPATAL